MSNFAQGGTDKGDSQFGVIGPGDSGFFRKSGVPVRVILKPDPDTIIPDPSDVPGLRIQFNSGFDPYTLELDSGGVSIDPYSVESIPVSMRIRLVEENDTKLLVGAFETLGGGTIIPIQLVLDGQTIKKVCDVFCSYPGVFAETLNGSDNLDAINLLATTTLDASSKWAYILKDKNAGLQAQSRSTLKQDIKFFFTTAEPNMEQLNPSQSVGGYISTSTVYKSNKLSSALSFDASSVVTNNSELNNDFELQINDEIVKVEKWNNNIALISERRLYDTPIRFHGENSAVIAISSGEIFDNNFNDKNKQYRCFALKNTNKIEVARNVVIFLNVESRNILSNIKLAVEIPRNSQENSSITSVDNSNLSDALTFVSSDFIRKLDFGESIFVNSLVTFTSGLNINQSRIISDFSSSTGTFTLLDKLPSEPSVGDLFVIDTSPSQRIRSGLHKPIVNTKNLSSNLPYVIGDFEEAKFIENGININPFSKRANLGHMFPGDIVYVWIERSLNSRSDRFDNNRFMLGVKYKRI